MSPKVFLLISRSKRPPLRNVLVTCAISGNIPGAYGAERQFAGNEELKRALKAIGLNEYEIDDHMQRVRSDCPTFLEVSIEAAEKLGLIER
jgi:hypothetical protein